MIRIIAMWYLIGLLVFVSLSCFHLDYAVWAYYGWDKGKDILLFLAILSLVKKKEQFPVKCMLGYSIIRFVWEIISYCTGLSIANNTGIGVLFLALLIIITILIINDLKKEYKRGH